MSIPKDEVKPGIILVATKRGKPARRMVLACCEHCFSRAPVRRLHYREEATGHVYTASVKSLAAWADSWEYPGGPKAAPTRLRVAAEVEEALEKGTQLRAKTDAMTRLAANEATARALLEERVAEVRDLMSSFEMPSHRGVWDYLKRRADRLAAQAHAISDSTPA